MPENRSQNISGSQLCSSCRMANCFQDHRGFAYAGLTLATDLKDVQPIWKMLYEIFDCITSFLICYLFYYAGQSTKSSMCFLYDLFVLPFSSSTCPSLSKEPFISFIPKNLPPPAFIFLQKYFPHLIFIKLSFSQLFQSFQSGFCPYQRMLKWFQSKAKVMV